MRTQTSKKFLLLALAVLTIGFWSFANDSFAANFNKQINYQGKLTNSSGVPVADGTYQLVFNLYTAASGGTAIWTESRSGANEIQVTDGLFSVLLGEVTSIANVDFNQTLYLGVTVESDSEMTPRKKLGTVPAAFEADKIDGLDSTQLVRGDATSTIATSSATTILTINQNGGAGNILDLQASSSTLLTVTSAGRLGVGTTTPSFLLSVQGQSLLAGTTTVSGLIATSSLVVQGSATSTFTGGISVSGGGLASSAGLTLTGGRILGTSVGTSTLSNGWDISVGCYAISGTCVGGSSLTGSGAANRATFWTSATNLSYDDKFVWDNTNKRLGLGTTSPRDVLHIEGFIRTDDVAWALNNDFGATPNLIQSFGTYNGQLYAGLGGDAGEADAYVYNGNQWSLSNDFGAAFEQTMAFEVYNGKLYVGLGIGNGDGDLYSFDGTTWSVANDFGASINRIYSLKVYNDKLYIGLGDDAGEGDVWVYDGTTFSSSYNGVYSTAESLEVYNGLLYAGFGDTAGEGDVWIYDGNTWTKNNDFGATIDEVRDLAVYKNKLYAALGDESTNDGDVYVYDGTTWSLSRDFGVNVEKITSLGTYNGYLYAGLGTDAGDGDLWRFDGATWASVQDFGAAIERVMAILPWNGKLFVGIGATGGDADVWVYSERLESQLATDARNTFGEWTQHFLKDVTFGSRVGIGTTSPSAKLSVWGPGTGGATVFNVADSASTTVFTVLDNGRVGISTTSPYARLSVVGETVSTYFTATSTTATSTFAGDVRAQKTLLVGGAIPNVLGTLGSQVQSAIFQSTTTGANATAYNFYNRLLTGQTAVNSNITGIYNEITQPTGYVRTGETLRGIDQYFYPVASTTNLIGFSNSIYLTTGNHNHESAFGFYSQTTIDALGPRINNLYHFYAEELGTNIQATTSYGFYAADQSRATTSYGVYVADQTLSTPNSEKYGLYVQGGKSYFGSNLGIGTTTPNWSLQVASNTPYFAITDYDAPVDQKHWLISNGGGTFAIGTSSDALSATTSRLVISNQGRVGVGTSTPWGRFSIVDDSALPKFVIATSSGATPLFFVDATTTGALDYTRVSVGTTTTFGTTAGLRDQFTVAGRIYSTWKYASCDLAGMSLSTTITADLDNVCGQFSFDADTANITFGSLVGNPQFMRIAVDAITGAGGALRAWNVFTAASSSPAIEGWLRVPASAGTNVPLYIFGFFDNAGGSDTATLPNNGIYFTASTSNNWGAVTRDRGTETFVNTNIATSSNLQKLRIETSSSTITYLINGTVVATITTNIPSNNLAPVVLAAMVTGGNPPPQATIDISTLRLWVDDPPGGAGEQGVTLPETVFAIDNQPYDEISGAVLALASNSQNKEKFQPGSIVTFKSSGETVAVGLTNSAYDQELAGVIAVSPKLVLGEETKDTLRVALFGRAPVLVSDLNGPIEKGDRITSSIIPGVGMKATRPGYVLGVALESFLPGPEDCQATTSIALFSSTTERMLCTGEVLIRLHAGFDMGVGDLISEFTEAVEGVVNIAEELKDEIFNRGAALVKLTIGKIVARVAVVRDFFAKHITAEKVETDELCVGDTCINQEQLKILLEHSGIVPQEITEIPAIEENVLVETVSEVREEILSTPILESPDSLPEEPVLLPGEIAQEPSLLIEPTVIESTSGEPAF